MAALQSESGVPLASGENLCTRYQHAQMIAAGAVTYVQPSVTKVGGVTEFLAETGPRNPARAEAESLISYIDAVAQLTRIPDAVKFVTRERDDLRF